ncbi:HD domain-containing protein [Nonomuraea phyllanthi]|uniref:HD domain-containing protein n=1 Tax=Nonomuraea phyllanthi TaxID=2219224 RepID=UPI0018855706|nr:metal-dependent phosphohydrolase [Nonomuraea phyllanthi]
MIDEWTSLAGDSPASLATGAELIARWSEPHRRYHTLDHLAAVLDAISRLAGPPGHLAADRTSDLTSDPASGRASGHAAGLASDRTADLSADLVAVRLAAWFHDAVYDGLPGRDEERSAQLAQARLPRCGVPAARVAEVARLVRLTAAHDTLAGGDRNGAMLCDADLAVLGRPGYDEYAARIRQEYAHVPDDLFRAGRAEVLRRLLAVPSLYRTARVRELWERAARANMSGELAALTAAQARGDQP